MQTEVNIVRTLGFLFISLFIAYLVNKIWNKKDKSVPLPEAPSDTSSDTDETQSLVPAALREELMMINKLGGFSIGT